MRQRRDSFGRHTFIPERAKGGVCAFCGQIDPAHSLATRPDCAGVLHRTYTIRVESDGGRDSMLRGEFCSWSCAEAYTGSTFPH